MTMVAEPEAEPLTPEQEDQEDLRLVDELEAESRALDAEDRDLARRRYEARKQAARNRVLIAVLRERVDASREIEKAKAEKAEKEQAAAVAGALVADITGKREAAAQLAASAQGALASAQVAGAEPAELVEAGMRAEQSRVVVEHEQGRLHAAREAHNRANLELKWAAEAVEEAKARHKRANDAVANPPEPVLPEEAARQSALELAEGFRRSGLRPRG
jgi:hypothetical protein